jgi:ELWxxDGT repeat protein
MPHRNSNNPKWFSFLLLAGTALSSSSTVHAGIDLVVDINQTPGTSPNTTADSNPSDFVEFDGHLVFVADDGVHGRELWQSDGTAAGTKMIVDLAPGAIGSVPNNLVVANGLLYFFASDAQGASHLMVLAPASTSPVSLAPLSAYCPSPSPAVINGKVFFSATDSQSSQIWVTDGTPAGTVRFDQPSNASISSSCPLGAFNNTLYIAGPSTDFNQDAIWSVAGTWANVRQLTELPFDEQFGGFVTEFNGAIYYNASVPGTPLERSSHSIFRSVETQLGAAPEDILGGSVFDGQGDVLRVLGVGNGRMVAEDIALNPPAEITVTLGFSTDGVSFTWLPNKLLGPTLVSGGLTFAVASNSPGTVGALLTPWVTDGTAAGTHRLTQIGQNGASNISWFADYHGTTLFSATDPAAGQQLWHTDGTTTRTGLIGNVPATGGYRLAVGSNFFFIGQDPTAGKELYVYVGDPVAADLTAVSSGGHPVRVSALTGAYVPGGGTIDPSGVKIASTPSHGTATVGADGFITYTPISDYVGDDSFTYTVADSTGKTSASAKATVTMAAPPPAPATKSGGGAWSSWELLILCAALVIRRRNTQLQNHDRRAAVEH